LGLGRLLRGRRRRPADALQLIALLALSGCGGAAPEEAAPQPPPGTLFFVADGDIVSMPAAGGERRLLATGMFPAGVDPKGTHALLVSADDRPEGHREALWLVEAGGQGGAPRALVPEAERVRNPAWAPDGSFVVYESDANSFRDLYRVDREGLVTRLTDAENGSFEPAVSADGQRIAFASSRDGNAEIYVMDADGSDVVRLTEGPADDTRPGWDPKGGRISWLTMREGPPALWTMAPDGSGAKAFRELPPGSIDVDYAWSPQGDRIAIVVQSGPTEIDIHVHDAATGARIAVLGGPGVDEHPAWSPDGEWIAWTDSRGEEGADIRLSRFDGAEERALTSPPGTHWLPRWGP
jgi:TolB protein